MSAELWLVIATVCDCDHTTVTLMDSTYIQPGDELNPETDTEIVRVSNDWRMAATQAATQLAERTGTRISGQCCVVHLHGLDQRTAHTDPRKVALDDALTRMLYRLEEERDEGSNVGNDGEPGAGGVG
jgi:hypothetical protein